MFTQFGATAESLSKASSLVLRIGTDAHLYDDPDDVSIAPLLDSRFDSEKVEALKRLLALIAQGDDISSFFPQVVKNVASQCLEVKKLVYLYLLHYAEKRPDEALLSINCFQKDLSDPNPLVRAWALRTMAGIRLHTIAPLVSVALNKSARDPSAYVRKCAANALPKLSDLHLEENNSIIEELVSLLLGDHSPVVVGAAANAFNFVCPHKLSMIGRNFRRLCEILPDVEEWGQIMLIEILLRYSIARHGLVKESVIFAPRHTQISHHRKAFLDDHPMANEDSNFPHTEELGHESSALMFDSYIEGLESYLLKKNNLGKVSERFDSNICTTSQNDDIKLLLRCTSPLLWSHNSAVVLAAAGVHWIMCPRENLDKIVKPVLFLLRSSPASKYVVLCNIQVFAKAMPSLFAPYYEDFFVYSLDPYPIRTLKLEILSAIATDSSISHIFQEMQDYIRDPDRRFAADAVAAVGLCAQRIPVVANSCIEGLLALIKEESSIHECSSTKGEAGILVQAIMSIKAVIKRNPANYEVIVQLTRTLEVIKVPPARALIVWMVGEYSSVGMAIRRVIPVIVKYIAYCFTSEDLETKHQILNTVAKVALSSQGGEALMFQKILNYLLELAKYDLNYDLRDRARVMGKLVSFIINSSYKEEAIWQPPPEGELSSYIVDRIFCGKMQSSPFQSNGSRAFLPGTLSQVVLHAAPGYEPLPKPCSLPDGNPSTTMYMANAENNTEGNVTYVDNTGSGDSDSFSGSSEDDSGTVDSERSDSPNDTVDYHTLDSSHYRLDSTNSPLISFSELTTVNSKAANSVCEDNSSQPASDLAELMSKAALESWLDEQPNLSGSTSSATTSGQQASVRISVKEIAVSIKPTVNNLLHPISGNGLKMNYSFSQEVSKISPVLVCVDLLIENTTAEPLTNVTVKEGSEIAQSVNEAHQTHESSSSSSEVPDLVPFEEIASLAPGQKVNRLLQIRFYHHLLPNKLVVVCNEKKYPVKLQPDIGYFVKPLQLDIHAFAEKKSWLPGMFEYNRRCTFSHHVDAVDHGGDGHFNNDKILVICRKIASKVLSGANVFFVSADMPVSVKFDDASGLCLTFSGEILSSSKPLLLTITAEGNCSEPLDLYVKVNCEDTIFGLNLLNRVVSLLS